MSSVILPEQDRESTSNALPHRSVSPKTRAGPALKIGEQNVAPEVSSALISGTHSQESRAGSSNRHESELGPTSSRSASNKTRFWQQAVRACGVGIDVGSYLTKVVYYDPSQKQKYTWATIPTCAGTHRTDGVGPGAEGTGADPLGSSGILSGVSSTEGSLAVTDEHPRRRRSDGELDFSRWSQKQLEHLSEAIVNATGKVRTSGVRITVSMQACELRSIPVYPQENLTSAEIYTRLQSVIDDKRPQSLALLDGQTESNRQKILSIPVELTDGLAVALDHSGLTPKSIEGLPWTLARLAAGDEHVETIVDWGVSAPTLVCVRGGLITYVRRLRAGGLFEIMESLIKTYDLSKAEALRWLQSATQQERAEGSIHEGVREVAQMVSRRLASEVDAALEYVRWKNSGVEIGPVTVVGGGAELALPVETLKQSLEYKVQVSSMEGIPPSLSVAALLARAEA